MKNDLTNLSINLIKDKEFMKKLSEKIRNLYSSKNIDINKALSEQKKIYILGETGVGKSTLINCLEEEQLAREAKISVPTTLEYKEYISKKYKNYIFCDTRGIETKNYLKIVKFNIKKILENSVGLNSYLFWYLKGSSSNFQDSDVNYIKSIQKSLNGKMPLFLVITKSVDEDKEKESFDKVVKEYFPCIKNIPILPLLARGGERNPSFGLNELMNETQNYFKKDVILNEIFKHIYINDDKFNELFLNLLNDSKIEKLFHIILNYIRLDDYSKEINDVENEQIHKFISEKYNNFVDSNIEIIIELCCLIKAKYEIIDFDNVEKTTIRLSNINNSNDNSGDNIDQKEEILQGLNEKEKEKIKSKAKKYYSDNKIKLEVKKFFNLFLVTMFINELKEDIKNNLLLINGLLN